MGRYGSEAQRRVGIHPENRSRVVIEGLGVGDGLGRDVDVTRQIRVQPESSLAGSGAVARKAVELDRPGAAAWTGPGSGPRPTDGPVVDSSLTRASQYPPRLRETNLRF